MAGLQAFTPNLTHGLQRRRHFQSRWLDRKARISWIRHHGSHGHLPLKEYERFSALRPVRTLVNAAYPMVDHPFKRKRSGGPKTAAGKAKVAGNALSHGINSHLVTLPTEDPAEFDVLFQGLVADFRPNSTIETSFVHRITHLMWKQRRLESYEQQQMSHAAAVEVKIEEIFKKMKLEPPSVSVCSFFHSLDESPRKI